MRYLNACKSNMQKLVFVYIQVYQTNVNISARKLVVSSRAKKKEKKKQVYMKMNVVLKIDYRVNPNQAGVSESLKRQGGAKWPTGENRLYWPYFCILNIKNHIKGVQGHKSCPKQGP